jgi:FAD:protein FMN transferase
MLRVFLILAALALPAPAEEYLTREQALQLAFPQADARAERVTLFSAPQQAEVREHAGSSEAPARLCWWRFERAGKCLGYACIDEVLGKEQPITFLVSTDAALRVRSVEILAYRETHGGEIRRADWRAQFVGKDPDSPLRVGRDVRNIAGATISCRSLTNGVRVRLEALRRAVARDATPEAARPVAAASPAQGAPTRRCQLLMGTTLTITLDAPGDARSDACLQAAFDEVRRLDGLLSDWDPASELNGLNRSSDAAVGPELEEVLGLSLEIAAQSEGAFDPSVGPLVLLWREARTKLALPEPAACAQARERVGWKAVELDHAAHRARLAKPGMALDLGGIGKGFALERAAAILRAQGYPRALLDFGGQLLALDAPPGKSGWPVRVRDPRDPEHTLFELTLHAASLSTTSDDQQGWVLGGQRYSHVFDPRRGAPVEGRACACVLAPEAARADAWSTALYVLGSPGLPLAERAGIAALVLEGDGALHETESMRQARAAERP